MLQRRIISGVLLAGGLVLACGHLAAGHRAVPLRANAVNSLPAKKQKPTLRASALPALRADARRNNPRAIDFAKLPLSFEPNQGQAGAGVKFFSRGRGYTLSLTPDEAVLSLPGTGAKKERASLHMKLEGAQRAPKIAGEHLLQGKSNYLFGSDPKKWRTNIPHYERVKYRGVYRGVDLVYYGSGGELEYDFVVAPGADPRAIRVGLTGAERMEVDATGDLLLHLSGGSVRLRKPVVYQEVSGKRQVVEGRYHLRGKNGFGFSIGRYDKTKTLVIDPVLSFSTYAGVGGPELGVSVAVDSAGNSYAAGSFDAFGHNDIFVHKLDPSGNLIYLTGFGGNGDDRFHPTVGAGLAVDAAQNVYLAGSTDSADFPVAAGIQANNDGGFDAFVSKLDPTGTFFLFSTYLGGSADDRAADLALGPGGDVFVGGSTNSTDFDITVGAFQNATGPEGDAFIARFTAAGSLTYCTALRGNGFDEVLAIAVDSASQAYVTGTTGSFDFPTTGGVVQPATFGGGVSISADSASSWSRFSTGIDHREIYSLALNPANAQIIYAGTQGGVYQTTDGGATWSHAFFAQAVRGMAIDPSTPTTVYAAIENQGVFKSIDGGSNWSPRNAGLTDFSLRDLVLDPLNPQVLYAVTRSDVFKSTDGGVSWAQASSGLAAADFHSISIFPLNTNLLLLAGSNGVYHSANGAASWTDVTGTLSTLAPAGNFREVMFDTADSNAAYVGLENGEIHKALIVSAGLWTPSFSGLRAGGIRAIAVQASNPNNVFAGGALGGVFLSTDAGATWTAANNGAIDLTVNALALDAAAPGTVIAGTQLSDAFVAAINASGSNRLFNTFLGGRGPDAGTGIVPGSDIIVAGVTSSSDFVTLGSPVQPIFGGGLEDGFVTSLNGVATLFQFSTFWGGSGDDAITAMTRDSNGDVWLAGRTNSTNFPVLAPFQSALASGGGCANPPPGFPLMPRPECWDAFVSKLSPALNTAIFSTYLGGDGHEVALGVVTDALNDAYVAGITASQNFPVLGGSPNGGGTDGFLLKIDMASATSADLVLSVSHSPEPVAQGAAFGLTVNVQNMGPDAASNVRVHVAAPTFTTAIVVNATTNRGSCTFSSTFVCDLGSMAPLDTAVITVTLVAAQTGTEQITVTAGSAVQEATPANNQETEIYTVVPSLGACSINFDGGAATADWSDPQNWDTNVLPGNLDNVCIASPFAVTKSTGIDTIHSLTADGVFTLAGGTLQVNAFAQFGAGGFAQTGGTLTGTGNVFIAGPFNWTGGTQTALFPGVSTQANGSTIISAPGPVVLRGRNLSLNGPAFWTGGFIEHGEGAFVSVLGSLDISTNDGFLFSQGGQRGSLFNSGVLTKNNPAAIQVDMSVNNSGTLRVLNGTLNFTDFYLQAGGTAVTEINGGSIIAAASVDINNGTLQGVNPAVGNAITGNVTNVLGAVRPGIGPAPGVMTINGDYTQLGPATLQIELAGTSAGQFDRLVVTGTANLDGTLDVASLSGFIPANGNAFAVMSFGSHTNDFFLKNNQTGSAATMNAAPAPPNYVVSFAGGTCDVSSIASGGWHLTSTWNTGVVPIATDNVCIGANHAVSVSTSAQVANTLTVTSSAAFSISGGTLAMNSASIGPGGFVHAGGLLTLAGAMAVAGPYTWSSGTLNGGGTIAANGLVNVSGSVIIHNVTWNLNAGAVITGAGINHGLGSIINLAAGQTFDLQGDFGFSHSQGGTRGTFNNLGTFRKSAGAGLSNVDMTFTDAAGASYAVTSGTLRFQNGASTFNGPFAVTAPGAVDFVNVTYTFNATSGYSGTGVVNWNGATIAVPGTFSSTAAIVQSAGILNGAGTVNFNGPFSWGGGTQTGGGISNVATQLNIGNIAIQSRTLNLNGGAIVTSAGVNHGLGAIINLPAGQTFDIQGDFDFAHSQGGTRGTFNNLGTFIKSAGTGLSTVDMTFTDAAASSWNVATGTVRFQNGSSTFAAPFTVASGALLDFLNVTYTFASTSSFSGAGTVNFNGAIIAVPGTLTSTAAVVLSNGALEGAGTMNFAGPFTWSAGIMRGTGITNVAQQLNISGAVSLQDRTLNLTSGGRLTGGGLHHGVGSIVNLPAGQTFDIQGDFDFVHSQGGARGTFNNLGTFTKSAGAALSTLDMTFTDVATAAWNVATGTLRYQNGSSTFAAPFTVGSGALLDFINVTYTFNSTSGFSGAGTVNFNGANVAVPGTLTSTAPVVLSGGALEGAGTMNFNNAFTWSAGIQRGGGTTNLSQQLQLAGNVVVQDRTLNLNAGARMTASSFNHGVGSIVNLPAGQTFDIQGDFDFVHSQGGARATFNNLGTFTKSAGAGLTTLDMTFTDTGASVWNVATGTVRFQNGPSTFNAPFTVAAGAALDFINVTYTLNNTSGFGGAGQVNFNGANIVVPGTVTSTAAVVLSGGALEGAGTMNFDGAFSWTAGIMRGTGTTNFATQLNLAGNVVVLDRTLNLNAGAVMTASALNHGSGSIVNLPVGQTFDIQGDFDFLHSQGGARGTFNNLGTFTKSAGAGLSTVDMTFVDVLAAYSVGAGTLRFQNGPSTFNSPFTVALGAALDFINVTYTFNSNSGFSGAGTVNWNGAAIVVAGTLASAAPVSFSGGTLQGGGTMDFNAPLNWSGGTMNGGGISNTNALMTVSGSVVQLNRTLNVNAGAVMTGGINHGQGAVLNLPAGQTFDVQGDFDFVFNQGGTRGVFNNAGTFRKSAGTGTSASDMTFNNAGSFEALTGVLQTNTYTQTGAGSFTRIAGGAIQAIQPLTINGGVLEAVNGPVGPAITGSVVHNGGTLRHGISTGTVTITGNYTQGGAGAGLLVELRGIAAGQFDVFAIGGIATLNGSLGVSSFSFVPAAGNTFQVMTYASRVGDFVSKSNLTGSAATMGTTPGATNYIVDFGTGVCTMNAVADGDWDDTNTWDTASVPTSADNVCIGGNFAITIPGGAQQANSIVSTSTSPFTLAGGSLVFSASSTIGAGGFDHSGGSLNAPGLLTVNGPYAWSGGSMDGGGITTVTGLLSLSNTTKVLRARTLNIGGGAIWTAGIISHGQGGIINLPVGQAFNIQGDPDFSFGQGGARGVFNNQGTIHKTAGAALTTFDMTLNHTGGAVNALSGELSLGGDVTASAPFGAISILHFNSGTHTLNGAASVVGAGTVRFSGTTANISSTYNVTGATEFLGGITTFAPASTVTSVGALTINGGVVNFNSGAVVAPVGAVTHSNGTLGGTDTVNVAGAYNWSGGSMDGGGTTTIAGLLSLTNTTKVFRTRTLNLNGGAVWTAGIISHGLSGVINQAAGQTFDIQGDLTLSFGQGGTRGVFNNLGTIVKSSGAGLGPFDMALNHNGGLVNAASGELSLQGDVTAGAPFTAGGGAILHFNLGTHNLNAGAAVSGAGTVRFSTTNMNLSDAYNVTGATEFLAGTTTFTPASTVTSVGALTVSGGVADFSSGSVIAPVGTVTHSGGTLGGTDLVNVAGAYNWSGGSMDGGGTTTIAGLLSLTNTTKVLRTRTLNLNGGTVWTAGIISHGLSGVINQAAGQTFDIQGDLTLSFGQGGARAVFNNLGSIVKSSGAGMSPFDMALNHTGGLVHAASGELSLQGDITASAPFTTGGGAILHFSAGVDNLNAGASVSGAGTARFSATTVNLSGSYNVTGATEFLAGTTTFLAASTVTGVGALTVSGGVADFSSGNVIAPVGAVTHSGGTLGGTDTVNVAGAYNWSGGAMDGGGTTAIAGLLSLTNTTKILRSRSLNINGGAVWTAGIFSHGQGGVINLAGGQVFDVQGDLSFSFGQGGAPAVFNNLGTFIKSAGAGVSNIDVRINNADLVHAASGILQTTQYFQVSLPTSITRISGGSITATQPLQINIGVLEGVNPGAGNAITGDVNNAGGTVRPGLSPGVMTISGNYTQGPGGTLQIELGGTAAGQFDVLNITGIATLDGALNVTSFGGFVPGAGNAFQIMTFASRAGDFATKNNLTGSAASLQTTPGATNYLIDFGAAACNVNAIAGGDWANTATWDTGSVPTAVSNVCIGGNFAVSVVAGAQAANTLTVTSTAPFTLNSGSLALSGGSSIGAGGFSQSGGTLTGGGSLLITGPFTWSAGTQEGGGITTATTPMAVSATVVLRARTLNLNGGALVTGTIFHGLGAIVNLPAGQTFDLQGNIGAFAFNQGGANSTFNNLGTFTRSSGAGTAFTGIPMVNTGTVSVITGTLQVNEPFTSTGTVNATGTLDIANIATFNSPSAVSGTGTVLLRSNVNFNAGSSLNVPNVELTTGTTTLATGAAVVIPNFLQNGGALTGTGQLDITNSFTWTAGTQEGGGVTNANAPLVLNGTVVGRNRTFNFNAGATATGTVFHGLGAVFNLPVGQTFDLQGNIGAFAFNQGGANSTFNNLGTFTRSVGAGTAFTGIPMVNTGTVSVITGTLQVNEAFTSTGAVNATGTLDITNVATFNSPSTVSGTGTVLLRSNVNFNAGSSLNVPNVELTTGTTTLATGAAVVIPNFLQNGGTLTGTGQLDITNSFTWTAGTQEGGGVTNASAPLVLNGTVVGRNRTFNFNAGVTATGTVFHGLGAVFNLPAGQTFDLQGNIGAFAFNQGGANSTFNNLGTFTRSAGAGTAFTGIPMVNTGTVSVITGTLQVNEPFTSTGAVNVTGTLDIANIATFNSPSAISGTGTVLLRANTNFNAGSSLNVPNVELTTGITTLATGAAVVIPNFLQNGGTLTGTGQLDITNSFTWTAGTQEGGVTNVAAPMTLNGTVVARNRTFNFNGGVVATGTIFHGIGAVFNLPAGQTYDLQGNISAFAFNQGPPNSTFNNLGTFTRSSGTGTAFTGVPMVSGGTVNVNTGTLQLNEIFTSTGPVNVTGTLEVFALSNFNGPSAVSGSGTVTLRSNTNFNAGSSLSVTTVNLPSATTTFNTGSAVTIPNFTHNGGTLTGTDTVTVTTSYAWSAGLLAGAGIMNANAPLAVTSTVALQSRTLNLNAGATATNGIFHGVGAVINLPAGQTYDVQGNFTILAFNQGGAASTFNNAGTVRRSSGTGLGTFDIVLNNTGIVEGQTGTTHFTSFTQSGGASQLSALGGVLSATPSFTVNGGLIQGVNSPVSGNGYSGTINNTAGTMSPGPGTPTLNVTGSYSQSAGGSYNVEVGGIAAGQFDRLALSGTATLSGTLNVTLTGGFVPVGGEVFNIITAGSRTGTFTATNFPALPAGLSWTVVYNAASVQLQVLGGAPAANLGITKTGLPASVGLGNQITYTITVSNAGPSNATGTTLTDVLPAQVSFVSATPTQGSCSGTTTVTCALGTISPAGSVVVTLVVTATSAGNVSNTATVAANEVDLVPANNSATANTSVSTATFFGPLAYTCQNDSPFFTGIQGGTIFLETFEDGLLNTLGVTASAGAPLGASGGTDSVDCDDGVIDGSGTGGRSFFSGSGATGIRFTFNSVALGGFPTQAGIVWTDGGFGGTITFEAFDAAGVSLGVVNGNHADASNSGTTGEDRFYGVTNPGGISAIHILNIGGGIEVDHLQYGTGGAPITDLALTKGDAPDPISLGSGNLTYTLTVANVGSALATSVTLTDVLPATVNFVSASPTQGSCGGTATVTCNLGSIAGGANATVTIVVTPTASGTLTNNASVVSAEVDPNPANNSAVATTTVIVSADVSVTKADAPDPVNAGNNLTYTLTVSNAGPAPATNVVLTDVLPAGVTLVSATSPVGPCTGTTTVTCNLGTMPSGTSRAATIVVTPTAAGTLTNTASVTATETDPVPANNSASSTTTVIAIADLSLTKTDAPDPVFAGANLTYTLTVSNAGPNTATGVTLTDTLPTGAAFVSATPSQGTCSGTTIVTCNLGTIANGAGATVTLIVRPTLAGTAVNTASVTSLANDPNAANNSATASTTVNVQADLSLTKTDSADPAVVNAPLTYTLTVTNLGPSSASSVVVTDTLPAGVTFVSASAGCVNAPGAVTCNAASIANGGNAVFTIVATPTAVANISNTASVTAAEPDVNLANNSATQATSVVSGPSILLSTTNLAFASQPVGLTSPPQAISLNNQGNAPLVISSIAVTGNFSQTNTCGTSLAASGVCALIVTFTPTTTGPLTGTLTLTSNAPGSPHLISLSGSGAQAPSISLSSSSLVFNSQLQGSTSPAQTLTLTNSGSGALTLTSITATGDFAQTNTCGTSVAVGASCTISVTFTPTGSGLRTGAITIVSNAPGSPPVVTLTGIGASPGVTLSTFALSFGPQAVATTSSAQVVTMTNSGSSALTITSIAVTGDFAQTNTCGTSLAASASCTITVTFTPANTGARNGSLTITDGGVGSPRVISLSGSGVAAILTVQPVSLTFSAQPTGTTSGAQTVTVSNTGGSSATISGITVTGNFAQTNTCGATLAAGANCTVSVTFAPTATGLLSGTLNIASNATGSPHVVNLTGTGIAAGPAVGLAPAQLTFAALITGNTSAAQAVTLTNTGNAALTIVSITAAGDFAQTSTCGASLAAGANCVISVTFTPTVAGARVGTLSIATNAASSPDVVALSGTGIATGPAVTLAPATLSFGSRNLGSTSAAQPVTLSNTGNTALTITGIAASGDYAQTNNCGASVAAGASCIINVTFTPTGAGARGGAITITDNAPGSPHSVALAGSGTDFNFTITAGSATVSAGQSATFNLSLIPSGGFAESVQIACTGAPLAALCNVVPSNFVLNSTTTVTVTVTTSAPAMMAPPVSHEPRAPNAPPVWPFALLLLGMGIAAVMQPRRRTSWAAAAALLVVMFGAACAGGTGAPPITQAAGTPRGNFTLTVTATSASGTTRTAPLTLTVQ